MASYHNPNDLIFIQSRAEIDPATVAEYSQMMADGVEFDAVLGIQDGQTIYVWDGQHRGEAARNVGKLLLVNAQPGTRLDAEWLALTANQKHGLKLTQRDKQRIVRLALLHPNGAGRSDREIARHCGVHHETVGRIRKELEASGEIRQIETRTVTRGEQTYQVNTAQIGGAQPDYVPIFELEQGVRDWLGNLDRIEAKIETLEDIKQKTSIGQGYLEYLLTGGILPGPRRKGDVIQACNNVLNQLQTKKWRQERAEKIKTMICLCGQQALEPVGEMDAIRCTACGESWHSIASLEGERTRLKEYEAAGNLCYLCQRGQARRWNGYIQCSNHHCGGKWGSMAKFEARQVWQPDSSPRPLGKGPGVRAEIPQPAAKPDQNRESPENKPAPAPAVGTRKYTRSCWTCDQCRKERPPSSWFALLTVDDHEKKVCEDCLLILQPPLTCYKCEGAVKPNGYEDLECDRCGSIWASQEHFGVAKLEAERRLAELQQRLPLAEPEPWAVSSPLPLGGAGGGPDPSSDRRRWNDTLCLRFAALVERLTLVNLVNLEDWLSEIEQRLRPEPDEGFSQENHKEQEYQQQEG